jgi:hypothetical protein
MKQDRFLQFILIGTAAIAVLAVVLFLVRKDTHEYSDDQTPRGVVENYTLAVFNKEYDRAYTYMAEDKDKPDAAKFRQAFLSKQVDPGNASLQVGETRIDGDHAYITLTLVYSSQGLFEDTYRDTQNAELVRQDGQWKIRLMPYPYWGYDWYQPDLTPKPIQPVP